VCGDRATTIGLVAVMPPHAADAVDGARRTRFTVLGMLGVTDGTETAVLQPSRPAALLAMLLLNANSAVSTELLQRVIWGDETPLQAKPALHSCVLRLRRLFTKYGVSGNLIEAVPGGYRLTADEQSLDLVEFRALLAAGYSEGDPETELATLRRALALWQPPLLPNVPSELLHRDEVPRLHEEWLRAIERVFDLELALGRHRQALAEIWSTARAHPLHERFTEQLMEALHRTGRRAEALAEYRRARRHLADHLGVDPGPALQRLELAILRGESRPADGAPERPATRPAPLDRPDGHAPVRAPEPAAASVPARSAPPYPDPDPLAAVPSAGSDVPASRPPHASPGPRKDAGPGARPGSAGDAGPNADSGTAPRPGPDSRPNARPDSGRGQPDAGAAPFVSGALVLERLVGAGLLTEGPRGHYRMHDLLRAFARAAAAEGVGARNGGAPHAAGRTTHPPSRPGAADLYPTEA
jgi:DNA-binding SARP family transcriptional activator